LSLTDRVVDLRRQFGTLLIIIATPQKTRKRERENLRSKIKRKKKTRVSLSLFSSRARAHPSDFHWLIAIDFDSSSSSSSLLHTQKVAFVGNHRQHSGCKNERAPLRETKREREREREKNEIQKKYTRERENTAHTDCFIISAIGSARATSRALVQQPHLIFVIIGYLSNHKDLFLRIITSARFVSYTIWFRATVKVMFEIIEYTSTRFS